MKLKRLYEDTIDQLIKNGEKLEGGDELRGEIADVLQDCYEQAAISRVTGERAWINPLFIGPPGAGKTQIVENWCKSKGIICVTKIVSQLDAGDVGGAIAADIENQMAVRLGTSEFQQLNAAPSILFLDEINQAKPDVLSQLFTIINEHRDPKDPSGRSKLRNLLFTVGAMNPSEQDMVTYINMIDDENKKKRYKTLTFDAFKGTKPLNAALSERFLPFYIQPDEEETKKWMNIYYDNQLSKLNAGEYKDEDSKEITDLVNANRDKFIKKIEGRKAIADKLLSSPKFSFDDFADAQEARDHGNGRTTMPRSLTNALNACDGTKASFLKSARRILNSLRYDMIETILADYRDVDDKANSVLKTKTDSNYINNANNAATVLRGLGFQD